MNLIEKFEATEVLASLKVTKKTEETTLFVGPTSEVILFKNEYVNFKNKIKNIAQDVKCPLSVKIIVDEGLELEEFKYKTVAAYQLLVASLPVLEINNIKMELNIDISREVILNLSGETLKGRNSIEDLKESCRGLIKFLDRKPFLAGKGEKWSKFSMELKDCIDSNKNIIENKQQGFLLEA